MYIYVCVLLFLIKCGFSICIGFYDRNDKGFNFV